MRVGFDISQIAHVGGVSTYTRELSEQLSKIPDLEMIYFYSSLRKPYLGNLNNIRQFKLPPTLFEMLFNRWRNVGIEKFIGVVDIFHSSDWIQPPTKAKKITTYHDVVPLKYPQWSHPKIVEVHKRRLKIVEKEIDCVIAVSNATKKDLMKVSNIPEEKITVVYEGYTADFKKPTQQQIIQFRKKYNLPKEFILAIGGIGERRNLARIKDACKDYNLVITGQSIPWLETEELGLLYRSASLLAYCSLYEGFGIPILDAFYSGLPVVTSDVSSMPEVGGSAAIYVNPTDVLDIKGKITDVYEDKDLRETMIKKGFEQVKKFSWEKAAKETVDIYRRLML